MRAKRAKKIGAFLVFYKEKSPKTVQKQWKSEPQNSEKFGKY